MVWMQHGEVFAAAGYELARFRRETMHEFGDWAQAREACGALPVRARQSLMAEAR